MAGSRPSGGIDFDQLVNDATLPVLSKEEDAIERELPLLVPLSHDHPLLSAETQTFNVDAFLLSRPNTSLADLRAELREYLAQLKEELVQLINDDYAAFISLRTDLRGEGPRLERIQQPLQSIQLDLDESRKGLLQIQTAIQDKLSERAALREEKTLLHLLLKISDLVGRLENMLLIPSPDNEVSSKHEGSSIGVRDMNGMISTDSGFHHANGDDEGDDHKPTVNRAKHLSRIAVEYNQLLYHVERARKQECAFVDHLQNRIDRIKTTLARDLDVVFSAALLSLSNSASNEAQPTAARARAINELSECLLIYSTLERWEAAEEVIRHDIVLPFVKKTIHPGALSAPLSPVIPRTPLLDIPATASNILSPTTPFTPHISATASASVNQTPISLIQGSGGTEDPLVGFLNVILRFVDRDCRLVIDLAERANSVRSYKRYKGRIANGAVGVITVPEEEDGDDARDSFDIMGGVVWAEIGRALMEELGTVLFAAGRPDEFQKNYTIVHEFITSLEYAAPSSDAVASIRTSRVFETFERRWQLPVYFQLRWKEIVGGLEDSLIRPTAELASRRGDNFFAPEARGIYLAVATCWSSTVFVPELGYRFWKLTLQILSRYKTWLDANLPMRRSLSSSTSEKPGNGQQPDQAEVDKVHLRTFACTLSDIRNLQRKMRSFFSDTILSLLPSDAIFSEDVIPAEGAISEVLSQLDSFVPTLQAHIIDILTTRCQEPLGPLRTHYRSLNANVSSRRGGVEPIVESSEFVPYILRPLSDFLLEANGPGVLLQKEFGAVWSNKVFQEVVIKYRLFLDGMKKTEDSLRRYNKSKRSTFMLFGAANSAAAAAGDDREARDEQRVRSQIALDVETLAKNARALGGLIDVDGSPEYAELLASASSSENQNQWIYDFDPRITSSVRLWMLGVPAVCRHVKCVYSGASKICLRIYKKIAIYHEGRQQL
ncbi:hypothetical protein DL93DRAFT_2168071 [Clavulina sp. PMI_390]|nr:hypothetical protein DL93DRAFT_2168071 [Clavulina sp. PMI_390]